MGCRHLAAGPQKGTPWRSAPPASKRALRSSTRRRGGVGARRRDALLAANDGRPMTPGVLRRYLVETYHYVCQNAKNQALVALRLATARPTTPSTASSTRWRRTATSRCACTTCASTGFDPTAPAPCALARHARLHRATSTPWAPSATPWRALGYSLLRGRLAQLPGRGAREDQGPVRAERRPDDLFVAHSAIDEVHFREVKQAIAAFCKTDQDWADVAYTITCVGRLAHAHADEEILETR